MKSFTTEIVAVIVTIVSSITAWQLGGRQKAKNDKTDVVATGAGELIKSMQHLLEEARKTVEDQRSQNHECEDELKKVNERLNLRENEVRDLNLRVDELELKLLRHEKNDSRTDK